MLTSLTPYPSRQQHPRYGLTLYPQNPRVLQLTAGPLGKPYLT